MVTFDIVGHRRPFRLTISKLCRHPPPKKKIKIKDENKCFNANSRGFVSSEEKQNIRIT